jgi:CBS domain-containing protein
MVMIVDPGGEELEVLEGDEGEPEIGRHRDVGGALLRTPIAEVVGRRPVVTVPPDAPVEKVLALMRAKKVSAVVVVERKKARRVVGLFSERDLVARALPVRGWARTKVERFMTPEPETLGLKDPAAYALNKMSVGRFRHVPLVDEAGRSAGMVTAGDLVDFLVELCPEEILNLPPEPRLAVHPRAEGD